MGARATPPARWRRDHRASATHAHDEHVGFHQHGALCTYQVRAPCAHCGRVHAHSLSPLAYTACAFVVSACGVLAHGLDGVRDASRTSARPRLRCVHPGVGSARTRMLPAIKPRIRSVAWAASICIAVLAGWYTSDDARVKASHVLPTAALEERLEGARPRRARPHRAHNPACTGSV